MDYCLSFFRKVGWVFHERITGKIFQIIETVCAKHYAGKLCRKKQTKVTVLVVHVILFV